MYRSRRMGIDQLRLIKVPPHGERGFEKRYSIAVRFCNVGQLLLNLDTPKREARNGRGESESSYGFSTLRYLMFEVKALDKCFGMSYVERCSQGG
jgi:hypothetical protein